MRTGVCRCCRVPRWRQRTVFTAGYQGKATCIGTKYHHHLMQTEQSPPSSTWYVGFHLSKEGQRIESESARERVAGLWLRLGCREQVFVFLCLSPGALGSRCITCQWGRKSEAQSYPCATVSKHSLPSSTYCQQLTPTGRCLLPLPPFLTPPLSPPPQHTHKQVHAHPAHGAGERS